MHTDTNTLIRYTHLCLSLSGYIIEHDAWNNFSEEFMDFNWQIGTVAWNLGIDVTLYMS